MTRPAWLADAPHKGGPHWPDCERVHPACAYRLGVKHGCTQATATNTGRSLSTSRDMPDRAEYRHITGYPGWYPPGVWPVGYGDAYGCTVPGEEATPAIDDLTDCD